MIRIIRRTPGQGDFRAFVHLGRRLDDSDRRPVDGLDDNCIRQTFQLTIRHTQRHHVLARRFDMQRWSDSFRPCQYGNAIFRFIDNFPGIQESVTVRITGCRAIQLHRS